MWWLRDHQRDWYGGLTLNHVWRKVKFDAAWNYVYSRGTDNYNYAGSSALAYPDTAPNTGPGSGAPASRTSASPADWASSSQARPLSASMA